MARYNTTYPVTVQSGTAVITSPNVGLFTTLTGTAPYTITLPNPTLFSGADQSFFNNTTGTITLSTPNGTIRTAGPDATTYAMPAGSFANLASNGTDYLLYNVSGGAVYGTTATFTGTTAVTGSSTFTVGTGATALGGTLTVTGTTTLNGNTSVTGTRTFSVGTGATTLGGGLGVTGNISATGMTSTPVSGSSFAGTTGTFSGIVDITNTTNSSNSTGDTGALRCEGGASIAQNLYAGNTQLNSLGIATAASGTAGQIRATNSIIAFYSDQRLKTVKHTIQDALAKVCSLDGVIYTQNALAEEFGYNDYSLQVGLLAQQVEKVLPEVVVPAPFDIAQNEDGTEYSKSGENYKTVQYDRIIPLLVEAIKELKEELNRIKGEK
tara:strand:- start:5871 stop:7013 length:1143 start_codon:yes stop_codon:yes gene_type:complete